MPILRYRNQSTRQVKHTRLENDAEFQQHYQYGAQLGKGSFGTVTEAICVSTNKKFAVKVINKEKVQFYYKLFLLLSQSIYYNLEKVTLSSCFL